MSGNTTALLTDFPKLSEFQENDLKDILSDDRLTNAVLFTVPAITAVMDEQEKLSRDNEELASKFST
jgi:ATP sulfurylase